MWELDHKEAWVWRIDAFEPWYWRRCLRVPWTARRSNQSIWKEISPEYSLEGLMLKLKLQSFGPLMQRTDSLEKTLMLGKIEGRRRRGQQRMRWWMASPTQWTWVWVNSGRWRWTGKPGMLQSIGLQRVRHNWVTELNWSSKTIVKATCLTHPQLWAKLLSAPLGSSVKWKKSLLRWVQYGTFYPRDSLSENSLVNLNGRDRNS